MTKLWRMQGDTVGPHPDHLDEWMPLETATKFLQLQNPSAIVVAAWIDDPSYLFDPDKIDADVLAHIPARTGAYIPARPGAISGPFITIPPHPLIMLLLANADGKMHVLPHTHVLMHHQLVLEPETQ